MDLREMHYLLEIANTGHMTQAANNLFISQPALSKSLRKDRVKRQWKDTQV